MRLRPLRPFRPPSSESLDESLIRRRGGEIVHVPAAVPWQEAYRRLERDWQVGQHFSLVARTRSGKTTFARELLEIRDWVVVFGTKPRDVELYEGFQRRGYVLRDDWRPDDLDDNRVIFRPGGDLLDTRSQREAFTRALNEVYRVGGWTVYIDEMLVLSRDLGMEPIISRMYTQAASNDVTMVAGTQRPRGVPLNMFEQAAMLALWKISDREDLDRAAMMAGHLRGTIMETSPRLPRYEVLIADLIEDSLLRTKVGA